MVVMLTVKSVCWLIRLVIMPAGAETNTTPTRSSNTMAKMFIKCFAPLPK
ncbi:Uncharacterised protein [Vibrio cholerae]|nr:Uncharacterised protein [Vibrio cholerae]